MKLSTILKKEGMGPGFDMPEDFDGPVEIWLDQKKASREVGAFVRDLEQLTREFQRSHVYGEGTGNMPSGMSYAAGKAANRTMSALSELRQAFRDLEKSLAN